MIGPKGRSRGMSKSWPKLGFRVGPWASLSRGVKNGFH
jgi:hypothetical protein